MAELLTCQLLIAHTQLRQHKRIIKRNFFQMIVASGRAAMSGSHVGLQQQTFLSVLSVRNLATYFAGSQYITWLSLKEVFTSIAGIRPFFEIVIRRILHHVIVRRLLIGIAPLLILAAP